MNGLLDENTLTSISNALSIRPQMSTKLLPNNRTLAVGIKTILQRKQLFPTIFFGVSSVHEAMIWNHLANLNQRRKNCRQGNASSHCFSVNNNLAPIGS